MAKLTKVEVHYSRGMAKSHCGICKHYDGNYGCEVVAGHIEPDMWCDHFKKKPNIKAKVTWLSSHQR